MCGISMLVSSKPMDLGSLIKKMNDLVRHRGPDDEGYALLEGGKVKFYGGDDTPETVWNSSTAYKPTSKLHSNRSTLALGHRRLAILDLTATGHQPMIDPGGNYLICLNGEIYNYIELKGELEREGRRFVSNSDTEVCLQSYIHWGEKFLEKLIGMFAVVIVDLKKETYFIARDRFGVKPIYFWSAPNGVLAIASEIKQFTVLPGWSSKLNHSHASDYLYSGLNDHDSETLFAGVGQLRGGEYCVGNISSLNIRPMKWYQICGSKFEGSFEEAVTTFRDLFLDSIKLHLRSDVPVGTGLSGGLDSSSITGGINWYLTKVGKQGTQSTFSACSTLPSIDERSYIEEVVKTLKVKAHYVYPDYSNLLNELPKIVWHQDEPFPVTSVFAEWCTFKLVSQTEVKVTIDGHGADEMLYGYHTFFPYLLRSLANKHKWISLLKTVMRMRALHNHRYPWIIKGILPDSLIEGPLKGLSRNATRRPWLRIDAGPLRFPKREEGLKAFSSNQLFTTSLPIQLHWADRDAMAHSIENRVPFLDHRLVEFIFSLPDHFMTDGGITKIILREACGPFLPELVKSRVGKIGFATPEENWLRFDAPEESKRLAHHAIESSSIFTMEAHKLVDDIIDCKIPYDPLVWRLISFGAWTDIFGVRH